MPKGRRRARKKSAKAKPPVLTREAIEKSLQASRADALEIARRLRPLFELPADGGPLIY